MTTLYQRFADSVHEALHSITAQMTLAARVAVLTTGAVAVTLAVLSTIIYVTARNQFIGSMDASLFKQADAAVSLGLSANDVSSSDDAVLAVFGIRIGSVSSGDTAQLVPPNASDQRWSLAEREVALGISPRSARTADFNGVPYRVVAVPDGEPGQALVLAQSMESVQRALDKLTLVLLSSTILGMAVAGAAGWAVAENGLRPVRRLTDATDRVARSGDLTPLEINDNNPADDLARLTASFNSMLKTLAESQARERQLVADAGHELRTPLTSLRTNVELLRQVTLSPDRTLTQHQKRELIDDVGAQLDELTTLVGDLVELAREDQADQNPQPLAFADIVRSSLDRVRRRAPDLNFVTELDDSHVLGDGHELERAVTNLLDNAAKWGPVGSTVTVRLVQGQLSITDQGPGISEEDLPRVFDRFYRSKDARGLPGSGLGLSIVRRTAVRHDGTVDVQSTFGQGATFTLTIPVRPQPPDAS